MGSVPKLLYLGIWSPNNVFRDIMTSYYKWSRARWKSIGKTYNKLKNNLKNCFSRGLGPNYYI